MHTYMTTQGDMWDTVTYKTLGNCYHMDKLLEANIEHCGYFIFPAGIELTIPVLDKTDTSLLPPWKRVLG